MKSLCGLIDFSSSQISFCKLSTYFSQDCCLQNLFRSHSSKKQGISTKRIVCNSFVASAQLLWCHVLKSHQYELKICLSLIQKQRYLAWKTSDKLIPDSEILLKCDMPHLENNSWFLFVKLDGIKNEKLWESTWEQHRYDISRNKMPAWNYLCGSLGDWVKFFSIRQNAFRVERSKVGFFPEVCLQRAKPIWIYTFKNP